MNTHEPATNPITLAQALEALRHDLQTQQPPPGVRAAVGQAARRNSQLHTAQLHTSQLHTSQLRTSQLRVPDNRLALWSMSARRASAALQAWGARWGSHYGSAAVCAAVLLGSVILMWRAAPERLWRLEQPTLGTEMARAVHAEEAAAAAEGLMPASHFLPLVSAEQLHRMTEGARAPAGPALASGGAAPAWLLTTELPQQRLAAFGLPYDPSRAGDTLRAELLVASSGEVLAVRLLD